MMKKQITASVIRKYADLTGDKASIHLLEDSARKAGYKAPIAHGMYIMGLAQSIYLAEHQTHWIESYSMQFHKPLVQDSTVSFAYETCDGDIQVTVTAEDSEVIAKGVFSVKEGVI